MQWISEYAVRAYTTADSAVSYLNHIRSDRIGYTVVCFTTHDCSRILRKHYQCELSVV